jgi:metal-sulfur cluster biosynthetic enzyme
MRRDWDGEIEETLASVPDPCSVAAGVPLGLTDMGLVRGWTVSAEGDLDVRLDVTSPLCLMVGHFVADARARLEAIPGVRTVTIRVDPTGEWSPEWISARGRERLARRTGRGAAGPSNVPATRQTTRSAAQPSRSGAYS